MSFLLALLRSAFALFAARESGASEQRAADQQAGQQETINALESRAATDDAVRGQSDADKRAELLRWSSGSGDKA